MSVYSQKFVISILVDGQVQKEFANGDVNIPFGCHYAIRFRNKNSRRAVVKLYIDGEKMCRGGFVIPANCHRDIDCSSQTLKKFKFVDLQSTEAQDHGKDQVNADKLMGVVEAHWHLEKEHPKPPVVREIHHHHNHHYRHWWERPWYGTYGTPYNSCKPCGDGGATEHADVRLSASTDSVLDFNAAESAPASYQEIAKGGVVRDSFKGACARRDRLVRDGATVEGDMSNMRFGELDVDYEEAATVLRLQLKGFDPAVAEARSECVPLLDPVGGSAILGRELGPRGDLEPVVAELALSQHVDHAAQPRTRR